jgi:hypothetical protein
VISTVATLNLAPHYCQRDEARPGFCTAPCADALFCPRPGSCPSCPCRRACSSSSPCCCCRCHLVSQRPALPHQAAADNRLQTAAQGRASCTAGRTAARESDGHQHAHQDVATLRPRCGEQRAHTATHRRESQAQGAKCGEQEAAEEPVAELLEAPHRVCHVAKRIAPASVAARKTTVQWPRTSLSHERTLRTSSYTWLQSGSEACRTPAAHPSAAFQLACRGSPLVP